ncbi:hypothetical protein [Streptomyces sp. NPDC096323]|uniref:hypothetical protein n=1 Tax=Streptomyces sp. NPDC096323 TaxID=3155822 RepID=UPI0033238D28
MNAYSYAHNNPLTKSDPDGLRPDGPAGGASYNDDRWADDRGMNAGYTYKSGKWAWHESPKKDIDSRRHYAAYRADPSRYMVRKLPKYVPGYQQHRPVHRQNGPDVAGSVKRGIDHVTDKVSKALATDGEVHTYGVCGGFSGEPGALGSAGGCFVWGKNPSGNWKFGISLSAGVGGPGAGLAGDAGYVQSNADDLNQLAGFGIDKSVSVHYAGGVTALHEGAVNPDGTLVRNSRQEPVWATSFGGGVGIQGGLGGGLNHTWMFGLN